MSVSRSEHQEELSLNTSKYMNQKEKGLEIILSTARCDPPK